MIGSDDSFQARIIQVQLHDYCLLYTIGSENCKSYNYMYTCVLVPHVIHVHVACSTTNTTTRLHAMMDIYMAYCGVVLGLSNISSLYYLLSTITIYHGTIYMYYLLCMCVVHVHTYVRFVQ